MSHYFDQAVHPRTFKTEEAEFLDGYFGPHRYGVRFSDGSVHTPEACHQAAMRRWELTGELPPEHERIADG